MPADEGLIERIRGVLGDRDDVVEKRMFGGVAFMVHGHMACGPMDSTLMVWLDNEGVAAALGEPHTREMGFTGQVIKSMLHVDPPGIAEDEDLAAWVGRAVAFAESLPPK